MDNRYFDLNIEQVLDNWEIHHAIREIIANSLDETTLTGCRTPDIFKDGDGQWRIRDYGRGLNYEHFTQNQNDEKLKANDVIGKFGVGLKDALAVLYSHHRDVQIDSKYGHITLAMHAKEDFDDMKTLHAVFEPAKNGEFAGTEFILEVTDDEIKKAKQLFLYFENKTPLDITTYGEIYQRSGSSASIYVNGVKVAEEPNYIFDYNITKQNAALRKALNRERSFLGRTAYSEIVKKMLLNSGSLDVISVLLVELKKIPEGTAGDEIGYLDVQVYAVKKYNALKPSIFMSSIDAYDMSNDDKEKIKESGRELVIVPDNVYQRVVDETDETGQKIGTFDVVLQKYSDNFEYHFVEEKDLNRHQATVWAKRSQVLEFLKHPEFMRKLKISTVINEITSGDTRGVWDGESIIIKQDVLNDKAGFYEVLVHELTHATSHRPDNDREFENALGAVISELAVAVFDPKMPKIPSKPDTGNNSILGRLFGRH